MTKLMNKLRESKRAQLNQSMLSSEYALFNNSICTVPNQDEGCKRRHHTMSINENF